MSACPAQTFDSLSQKTTTCGLELHHEGLHDDGCLTWRDPPTKEEARQVIQGLLNDLVKRARDEEMALEDITAAWGKATSLAYGPPVPEPHLDGPLQRELARQYPSLSPEQFADFNPPLSEPELLRKPE